MCFEKHKNKHLNTKLILSYSGTAIKQNIIYNFVSQSTECKNYTTSRSEPKASTYPKRGGGE